MIPASRPRLIVLVFIVVAMLGGLLTRVWFLQVKSGTAYAAQASSERVRQVVRQELTDSFRVLRPRCGEDCLDQTG